MGNEKLPTPRQILAKAYRDNGDIGAANYIEGGSDLLPDTQVHLLAIQDALDFANTRAPADLRSALEAETIERCNMGVGCEQYGVCYAEANGQPGQCPKNALSIDEAVSRIPDEAFWQLGHDGEGADPSQFKARVFNPMTMARPAEGWGDTPADAIRAALAPTKGDVS